MTRLFIALLIPDEIKKLIFDLRDEAYPEARKLNWEQPDKIHITLKFIGETQNHLTGVIADSLDFINDFKSFECELTGFGFFYNRKTAKILWAGLKIENNVFELVEKLNILLQEFSITAEKRKFIPHLTLKRLKGNEGAKFIQCFENFNVPPVKFIASKIALYKSELLLSGSVYTGIKYYNLK